MEPAEAQRQFDELDLRGVDPKEAGRLMAPLIRAKHGLGPVVTDPAIIGRVLALLSGQHLVHGGELGGDDLQPLGVEDAPASDRMDDHLVDQRL